MREYYLELGRILEKEFECSDPECSRVVITERKYRLIKKIIGDTDRKRRNI
jgi:hypothetical protein